MQRVPEFHGTPPICERHLAQKLVREGIQKNERMGLNDWSRAILLSSRLTHYPIFSGGSISTRSFILLIKLQGTGVPTELAGIAHVHVSHLTLEMEYVSAYDFIGPVSVG
ncbi:hypothetical protein NPIL_397951 [Nephila pilipes]|uniref:Uncharacterized protein n=1 Tax=Nephila pilipes TaxID=299642 RepID=A0A8X6N6C6_NEPPI|nr:hypothetical protein NPIL_397951 [Nephila pilipes]